MSWDYNGEDDLGCSFCPEVCPACGHGSIQGHFCNQCYIELCATCHAVKGGHIDDVEPCSCFESFFEEDF